MDKKTTWIYKDIVSSGSERESSRVYMSTDLRSGESELIIEKTIKERYPVTEYEKVMHLYYKLNCGGGRKIFTIEEIAHPHNPKGLKR